MQALENLVLTCSRELLQPGSFCQGRKHGQLSHSSLVLLWLAHHRRYSALAKTPSAKGLNPSQEHQTLAGKKNADIGATVKGTPHCIFTKGNPPRIHWGQTPMWQKWCMGLIPIKGRSGQKANIAICWAAAKQGVKAALKLVPLHTWKWSSNHSPNWMQRAEMLLGNSASSNSPAVSIRHMGQGRKGYNG